MSYGRHTARYREMEVLSAPPGQLVVLLFDHLLVTLRRARMAIESRDAELRGENLDQSRNIVTELLVTLDRDRGGEIADNLSALYAFLIGELVQIGVAPSIDRLDRISQIVSELREAFAQIALTAPSPSGEIARTA